MPALPTACYAGEDQWWDQSNAAIHAVQLHQYRQNDINDAIRQNATEAFGADPMAIAQRLQNAQKHIEQMNQQTQRPP